jgi:hypothetical protein
MQVPPLPFDQFPFEVRLIGRPTLGELWKGCYEAGFAAGEATGLAKGVLGTSAFFLALLVIALVIHNAVRSRQP